MKGKRRFRSWRKMSSDTQESMSSLSGNSMASEQPVSKKQKLNASAEECSLTGVKLSDENFIQLGNEKIWAPMLLLFSQYFSTIGSIPLTAAELEEAHEKYKKDRIVYPFSTFVGEEISSKEIQLKNTSDSMNELNIQKFWLVYLDDLEKKLVAHLKLDSPVCHSREICQLFYNLTLMLHTHIPSEALSSLNKLCKNLDGILLGTTFWEYNPIHLTEAHIWAHEFLDSVFRDHSNSGLKKNHIALSFCLAQAQHPFPEFRTPSEIQVCDQQLAIRFTKYEDEFDEEPGVWAFHQPALLASQIIHSNGFLPIISPPNILIGPYNLYGTQDGLW
jgi:hypothetical protein